ncbi:hypothetical protein L873DRAFT_1680729, partial [Choiromyces venosus 120613-1]
PPITSLPSTMSTFPLSSSLLGTKSIVDHPDVLEIAAHTLALVAPSLVMRPIAQGQLRSRRSRPSTDTMR